MPPLYLDVDTAIPVGLIVNELMTNSLKHAFSKQHQGRIVVSLCADEEDNLVLYLADNGVGRAAAQQRVEKQNSSGFGDRLVRLLVEQLGAVMEQQDEEGCKTSIRFPHLDKVA